MTDTLRITVIALVINLIMAVAARRLRWLTLSGAVTAFFIGFVTYRFTRLGGFLILMLFFVTATVLGRVSRAMAGQSIQSGLQKKGGTRDWAQVLANGALAAGAALLYGFSSEVIALVMFGASLAASTADTWSGEAGVLSSKPPISIRTGKAVPTGMSGGVSFLGTVSGMIGSVMIALSWYATFADYRDTSYLFLASIIAVSGVIGSLADSFLGAVVQGHYYDPERNQITEHDRRDGKPLELCRGIRWIDNDVVNVLSNVIAVVFASGLSLIFL